MAGSLQSILTTHQDKYLVLGINNQIDVYDFAAMLPTFKDPSYKTKPTVMKKGKLELLDRKLSGTFI